MLGTAEETSGVEQFVSDLREIGNVSRIIDPTKRNVVGVAAKFYDPMGFLSPIIIEFKMFLQELC